MDENKNPFKEEDEQKQEEEINKEEIQEETQEQDTKEDLPEEEDKEKQFEELNNKYIRLAADFDNFRKRTQSEKEEIAKYAQIEFLKKLMTVLDTFDRAKEHLAKTEDCKTVKDGYEMAFKQLADTLKKIGLEEIDAIGKPFNPNEHEAMTQVPTDEYEPDSVALVAQKGYKFQDKIVRAALVGVAVKKENE